MDKEKSNINIGTPEFDSFEYKIVRFPFIYKVFAPIKKCVCFYIFWNKIKKYKKDLLRICIRSYNC